MKKILLLLPFIALACTNTLAGPEEIKMIVDYSGCQNDDINLRVTCEHYDYYTDQLIHCNFTQSTDKTLSAVLSGDTFFDIDGNCNGRKRHCTYHFRPSKMQNVDYPYEIQTHFPNAQTFTVPLINQDLPILIVECN